MSIQERDLYNGHLLYLPFLRSGVSVGEEYVGVRYLLINHVHGTEIKSVAMIWILIWWCVTIWAAEQLLASDSTRVGKAMHSDETVGQGAMSMECCTKSGVFSL